MSSLNSFNDTQSPSTPLQESSSNPQTVAETESAGSHTQQIPQNQQQQQQQQQIAQPFISPPQFINPLIPIQQLQPLQQQAPQAPPGPQEFVPLPIPNPPSATSATSSTSPPKTLWMGDLDPWSDEESIVNLWSLLGKRVLVKLIKAKRGTPAATLNTGHAGYCFVEFETYEDAKNALSLNGSSVPNTNRVFRLNWASGATLTSEIPQSPEYSLFVGDLSPSTTEAHLLSLFQNHFSSVKTVRVMTDPITGTSRCFGFVRFSDEEERKRALNEMSGVYCAGRPLRVALATPRQQSQLTGNGGNNSNFGPYGQLQPQLFQPSLQTNPGVPTGFYDQHPIPLTSNQDYPFTDPTNTTVFIGGLANGIPEQTLAQIFQPFGPIIHVKIPPGKGCGFIRFENRNDAEAAIAGMQGFYIGGARVRLSWGRQQNQNQHNQRHQFHQIPPSAAVAAAEGGYPGVIPNGYYYAPTNGADVNGITDDYDLQPPPQQQFYDGQSQQQSQPHQQSDL
ncbi:hypothetical protein WICMUC_003962 [Wickerhamomyces mucosus]|uniref:RRM domain-containing protein n=1 Tax=Wickerhamomyces mucosus TaxID=1378264 RepID=A0A9P8TBU7_9ASCO|nr:hypothetical protein WICMUC_003962 [Wickerhamomyces mucosus]